MAELAVPLIALGSMYIISKQKKNEGYANMNSINNHIKTNNSLVHFSVIIQ